MAGLKEIKRRITSVKNTKKITYAMKLVSAAKLRKAQELSTRSRAYTAALGDCVSVLLAEAKNSNLSNPLLESRDQVKNILVVVAGGGRGLCGSYNTNVNKRVEQLYRDLESRYPGAAIRAIPVGRKVAEYFRRTKRPTVQVFDALPEDVPKWPIADISELVIKEFLEHRCDEVFLLYTKFKSAISMTPTVDKLLPMDEESLGTPRNSVGGGSIFEPSVAEVWNQTLPRVLRARMQQGFFDTKASEHGSRMTAMDAATKNSGEIIQKLTLTYNKLRQAGITSQIMDIVGGAEALN